MDANPSPLDSLLRNQGETATGIPWVMVVPSEDYAVM